MGIDAAALESLGSLVFPGGSLLHGTNWRAETESFLLRTYVKNYHTNYQRHPWFLYTNLVAAVRERIGQGGVEAWVVELRQHGDAAPPPAMAALIDACFTDGGPAGAMRAFFDPKNATTPGWCVVLGCARAHPGFPPRVGACAIPPCLCD